MTPPGAQERAKTAYECLSNRIMALRDTRCEAHKHYLCDVCAGQWIDSAVAQAVQAERKACAKIAEGFESPFSQEFPAEAWRDKLQTVILQAMLSAPKDGDDTQPERAIAEAVFAFLQTGRDGIDELFKTGNASAALRARPPEPTGEKR